MSRASRSLRPSGRGKRVPSDCAAIASWRVRMLRDEFCRHQRKRPAWPSSAIQLPASVLSSNAIVFSRVRDCYIKLYAKADLTFPVCDDRQFLATKALSGLDVELS
jgi:hypothetical protein